MELVYELSDGVKYNEEVARIATMAYMYNNPFLKPLKITKEQMYEEFLHTLRTRAFRWVYIFFEKEAYLQGNREIIGCMMWSDLVDFKPKGPTGTDYAVAPTSTLVRQYMRNRSVMPIFDKYNPKEGEITYGSGFGLNPKYMGQGQISYKMFKLALEHLQTKGYKYGTGHAINDIAKRVFLKSILVEQFDIDVSDTLVQDTQEAPFQGLNLSQMVFMGIVDKTIQNLGSIIDQRARL